MEMNFDLEEAVEVLSATPGTLRSLLGRLSADWTEAAESTGEWRAYDVVGHLIHGEETDWIPRARLIIEQGAERTFVAFDRFAQFDRSEGNRWANCSMSLRNVSKGSGSGLRYRDSRSPRNGGCGQKMATAFLLIGRRRSQTNQFRSIGIFVFSGRISGKLQLTGLLSVLTL